MHAPLDIFDPNGMSFDWGFRMYAGRRAQHECLVDEEDYLYFTNWLWSLKVDRRNGKPYFRRSIKEINASVSTVYLHIEILTRAEGPPPTRARNIADHLNGNSLDNRRANLRWATIQENNRNRFGSALQRILL